MDITKAQIKHFRSLSSKKYREKYGEFIIEGEKMVKEAMDSDLDVVVSFHIDEIGYEKMKMISLLSSPSPAIAIVKRRKDNDKIVHDYSDIALALDSVRDPGNLGTILRLADWFGIKQIFASTDTVELYNPKTVQASMGAIFRKNIIYTDLIELASSYKEKNLPIYGTFLDGENIYTKTLNNKGLIIMGSENNGISPALEEVVSDKLFIPGYPADVHTSESLNVAIATAITCSEFRRR